MSQASTKILKAIIKSEKTAIVVVVVVEKAHFFNIVLLKTLFSY
jgi:hypothetical protein